MKVYVALGRIDYEGDALLGVYSTEEAASRAGKEAVNADRDFSGGWVVEEREVDAAPYVDWEA